MDRRRIGRTSLEVSVLGFGGNALGNLYTIVDEAEARDTVLAAHETGVTYRIRAIVGEGRFTEDHLDTFGTTGVVEIPRLQDLLAYICRNGFEHHAAMSPALAGGVLEEALETYLGWDVYRHLE